MVTRYLIVGPAWVGDMIMSQTLYITLKQLQPGCQIDVIAPKSTLPLLERMPEVHQGIALPLKHGEFGWTARKQLGRSLRGQYDHAMVLPNSWKSALVPWFAKVPKRTGWKGECRYGLLNDIRVLDKARYPLMIERFIALAYPAKQSLPTPLSKPALFVSAEQKLAAIAKFQGDADKPILALCPGAEYGPAKQWPAEHYAAVARAKVAQGWQVWILGSPKDAAIADAIQQLSGNVCQSLAGKTSLSDAIDLLACADTVVTNDSGLMHIASALDKRVIAVYGSSSPAFTPPLSDQATILSLNLACSPCFKRECPLGHLNCLKQLTPERVLQEFVT